MKDKELQIDLLDKVYDKLNNLISLDEPNYSTNAAVKISAIVKSQVERITQNCFENDIKDNGYLYKSNLKIRPSYISYKKVEDYFNHRIDGEIPPVTSHNGRIWNTFAIFVGYFGWKGFKEGLSIEKGIEKFPANRNPKVIETVSEIKKNINANFQINFFLKTFRENRKYILFILFVLSILVPVSIFFVSKLIKYDTLPEGEEVILVLAFEGDENNSFQVELLSTLQSNVGSDIKVIGTQQKIDFKLNTKEGHRLARDIGKEHKASIVIWGHKIEKKQKVFYRITVVKDKLEDQNIIKSSYTFNSIWIGQFEISSKLVKKPTNLIYFLKGYTYFLEDDYGKAVSFFRLIDIKSFISDIEICKFYSLYGGCILVDNFNKGAGNMGPAIFYLNKSINLCPNSPESYTNLGLAYSSIKSTNLAIKAYNSALALDSGYYSALYNLAFLYKSIDSLQKANHYYKKALAIKPNSYSSEFNVALTNYLIGNREQGLDNFLEMLNKYPNDPNIIAKISQLYIDEGKVNQAKQMLSEEINNGINNNLVYFMLGQIYENENELNKAIDLYKKGIKIDTTSYEVYSNIGNCYNQIGEYDLAEKYLLKAIELDSSRGEAFCNLGNVYNKLYQYEKAIEVGKIGVQKDSSLHEGWHGLGYSHYKINNNREAIIYYNKALKIDSTLSETWFNKGLSHIELKQYKKALFSYLKSLKLGIENNKLFKEIGLSYYYLGNHEKAKSYYLKSIEFDSNYYYSQFELATLYLNLSQIDSAIFFYKKAEAINKNDEIYFRLGICYIRIGDYQKAENNLKLAYEIGKKSIVDMYLGYLYFLKGNRVKALEFYQKSYNGYNDQNAFEKEFDAHYKHFYLNDLSINDFKELKNNIMK